MFNSFLPQFLILYYVVSLLFILLILFLISRLFKIIIGKTDKSLLWVNIRSQILSLGLAIVLFSNVFTNLIKGIFTILNEIFFQIPQTFVFEWTYISGTDCQNAAKLSAECINDIWMAFIRITSTSLSNAFDYLGTSSISYTQLVLMLVFWVLLSLLITPYSVYHALSKEEKKQLSAENKVPLIQKVIDKIKTDKNNKLTFYLVLILGIYLSIAAIVAIPVLEEPLVVTESISAESLSKQLNDALTLSNSVVASELVLDNPFQELEIYLNQPHDFSTKKVQIELEEVKSEYDANIQKYSEFYNEVYAPMKEIINSGVVYYQVNNSLRKGNRETSKHFLLIDAWFRDILSIQELRSNDCRQAIMNYYENRQEWADTTLNNLKVEENYYLEEQAKKTEIASRSSTPTITATPSPSLEPTSTCTTTPTQPVPDATITLFIAAEETTPSLTFTVIPTRTITQTITPTMTASKTATIEISETLKPTMSITPTLYIDSDEYTRGILIDQIDNDCTGGVNKKYHIDMIPPRPVLGDNLGPFTFVASWLMRTESLALAQIVGLLGFGLLGAAVGSLIKNKENPDETAINKIPESNEKTGVFEKYFCSNVTLIIIRGASAALVVFLAVKGGLTVLNVADNDPNSYMLFLICLVAAVYSEKIWKFVEKKLGESTNGSSSEDAERFNQ